MYRFCTFVLRRVFGWWLSLWTVGEQYLPEGAGLIAANHASFMDTPVLATSSRRPLAFVARGSLGNHRLAAWWMNRVGVILIRPGAGQREGLRQIQAALDAGRLVAVFPEGTRTRDGTLGPFREGILRAAARRGIPIIPTAINGTWRAWPRHAKMPGRAPVTVVFGAPLEDLLEGAEALHAAVRNRVADLLEGASGES